MSIKARYLTTLLAAAAVCAAIAVAPVAVGSTGMHEHRPEHHAV